MITGVKPMFDEILTNLTDEQRAELSQRGIKRELLYAWRSRKRLPTEIQVVDVSQVTGADWADLQKEITVLRAPEERRADVARALNWRKR